LARPWRSGEGRWRRVRLRKNLSAARSAEDGGEDLRDVLGDLLECGLHEGIVGVFDCAAEDEDGAHAANVEQRWEGEEEGDEDSGAEAGEDGAELKMELGRDIDCLGENQREDELHGDAAGDSDEAAEDAEEEGLQEVDLDDLRAVGA